MSRDEASAGERVGARRRMVRLLAAAMVVWALFTAPAGAEVRFTFVQTDSFHLGANIFYPYPKGPLPAGTLSVSGSLTLSDDAFRSGVTIAADDATTRLDLAGLGLLDLAFTATYLGRPPGLGGLHVGLADLRPLGPGEVSAGLRWQLSLTGTPFGTPSGVLYYNNGLSDLRVVFAAAPSTGQFNTEFGGVCGWAGNCGFTGVLVAVPEPASLALLAVPAAVLAAARLRRRRPPAP